MAEFFFDLKPEDRREALEFARERTGRPAHLLEKDVWVVWTLQALFESELSESLTFKGGTSLSKAYKVIERFSEDVDLTYDIRQLIPDLIESGKDLPASRSQSAKWTKAVRERLPHWIEEKVRPVLHQALARDRLEATLELAGEENEKLLLHYADLTQGTGYVAPRVTLEFGARSTGEPHQVLPITCDMEGHVPELTFPRATPVVMTVTRTFWEKATAAHVYCAQSRIRGERYARHWHDLVAIGGSSYADEAISDAAVASAVAEHKSHFFVEKDAAGQMIDYRSATTGALKIVPEVDARKALEEDYGAMRQDAVLIGEALPFDELMIECAKLETRVNNALRPTAKGR